MGEGTDTEVLERGIYSETSDSEEQGIEGIGAAMEGVSVDDCVWAPNPDFDDISGDEGVAAHDTVFTAANADFEDSGANEMVFTTSNADLCNIGANEEASVDDMVFASNYNKDFED